MFFLCRCLSEKQQQREGNREKGFIITRNLERLSDQGMHQPITLIGE